VGSESLYGTPRVVIRVTISLSRRARSADVNTSCPEYKVIAVTVTPAHVRELEHVIAS